MWRDGLLTILVWVVCLAADFYFVSDPLWRSAIEKIATTLPLSLVTNEIVRRNFPCPIREGAVAFAVTSMEMTIGGALVVLGAVGYAYALFALIVCAAFAVLVMRLRFAYGCFVVLVAGAEALYLSTHCTQVSLATRSFGFSIGAMTAGILAVSAYLLEQEERLIFLLCAREERRTANLAQANSNLTLSAQTDFLSGLMNRRALEAELTQAWSDRRRQAQPVSAIMLDIDHFKKINDTFGHAYGDIVIARVASLLRTALRGSLDIAVRYGGEEFLILLPDTHLEAAYIVAERIRCVVELSGAPPRASGDPSVDFSLTVSCGVSSCAPMKNCTAHQLLAAADEALYSAKGSGRNRVVSKPCGICELSLPPNVFDVSYFSPSQAA